MSCPESQLFPWHEDPAFFLSAVSFTARVTAALKEIGKLVDLDVVRREGQAEPAIM
jgi:hypothetical protein